MLGREVEETLAPKKPLAQWVADSGDSADSPGSSPGDTVIREHREYGIHPAAGKGGDIEVESGRQ